MRESVKFIDRIKTPVGRAVAALGLVTTMAACDPEIVRQVADSIGTEQGIDGTEFTERYVAAAHAKAIEQTLNSGEAYIGAGFHEGMNFKIFPEFQHKYPVGTIYNPVALDGNAVGFFTYSGEGLDSCVTLNPVDAEHGEFEFADDPNAGGRHIPHATDLRLINFDYTPEVHNDPHNTMRVVVASDAAQSFVGQFAGPVEGSA